MSPKYRNGISFLRLFVLSPSSKHDGRTKRQSYREISKFDLSCLLLRFVVCSFCRHPQGAKRTERQCDKMRFCGHLILSFVRFVALYKSPKRRNEISFWRLFVSSPSTRRKNEQTKWPYPASIIKVMTIFQLTGKGYAITCNTCKVNDFFLRYCQFITRTILDIIFKSVEKENSGCISITSFIYLNRYIYVIHWQI